MRGGSGETVDEIQGKKQSQIKKNGREVWYIRNNV